MNLNMSNILQEKLRDGETHKVQTTGLPKLFVDDVEVYRVPSLVIQIVRRFPLPAMGVGFAVGLLVGSLFTLLVH